jgi:hypothetical protein
LRLKRKKYLAFFAILLLGLKERVKTFTSCNKGSIVSELQDMLPKMTNGRHLPCECKGSPPDMFDRGLGSPGNGMTTIGLQTNTSSPLR